MSRPPSGYYFRDGVYTDIGGHRRLLVRGPKNDHTRALARLELAKLLLECEANPPAESEVHTVASICDAYLESAAKNLAESTVYEQKLYLQKFCNHYGPRPVRECIPYHLTNWVESHGTWESAWTRAYAIRTVKRPFNWAVEGGLIPENPFAKVKLPKCKTRHRPITEAEHLAVLAAAGPQSRLGEVLRFLWFTGSRPVEARCLRWRHTYLDFASPAIVLDEHKTSSTQQDDAPRVIPLVPEAVTLLRAIRDREDHREFVFVNVRRGPWARCSIQQAFRRLRERLGLPQDLTAYCYRHRVGTESIHRGNDLRTTADLLGHKHTRTTERYVHPAAKAGQLAAAMARATKSGECV